MQYCSEDCQSQSWKQHHQFECGYLSELTHFSVQNIGHLAFRLITKNKLETLVDVSQGTDKVTNDRTEEYKMVHSLLGHTEHREPTEDLLCKTLTAIALLSILVKSKRYFPAEQLQCSYHIKSGSTDYFSGICERCLTLVGGLLLRHLQNMECNTFDINEYVQNGSKGAHFSIGNAVYLNNSLCNHACEPNVISRSYQGTAVALLSIQPIKKGQEIVGNYGFDFALHPKCWRQDCIWEGYFFMCNCIACENNWCTYKQFPEFGLYKCECDIPIIEGNTCHKCEVSHERISEKLQHSKTFYELAKHKLDHHLPDEALPGLYEHLTLLHTYTVRPNLEYYKCQKNLRLAYSLLGNYHYKPVPAIDECN